MTFTSGPWQRKDDYDGHLTIIGNVDGDTHADGSTTYSYDFIANCEDEYGEPASAANVRLILASPDLLEACEALVECFIKRGPFDEPLGSSEQAPSINAANAALDKARRLTAASQGINVVCADMLRRAGL